MRYLLALLLLTGCSTSEKKPTIYTVGLGAGDELGVITYFDMMSSDLIGE